MEHQVTIPSDGLKLSGVLQVPDQRAANERRPAIIVLHGFGSNKDDGMVMLASRMFERLGYVVLRFDMRGCGQSEGQRARVICLEQVADTRNAISFLQTRTEVQPDAIAVMGHSFGAAVAVYTAGVDERVAACISSGGWGMAKPSSARNMRRPKHGNAFRTCAQKARPSSPRANP